MNKRLNTILSSIAMLISSTACSNLNSKVDSTRDISIDINNCTDIAIDESLIIPLETSDSALLYDICSMEIVNDRLVIFSRDLLKIFDKNTGKFLGNLATRGEGPMEYLSVNRLWRSGDTLKIFDPNSMVINSYSPNAEFIDRQLVFNTTSDYSPERAKVNYFIELPSDGYVSINTWMGGIGDPVPTYSLYDSEYNFIQNIPGRTLRTGSYLMDRAFVDTEHNRLLTWEALIDTVFSVTPDGVEPIYAINFGENSFPSEKQNIPELSDRVEAFSKGEDIPYISLLGYYKVKGDNLFFIAYGADMKNYIIRYDENRHSTSIYQLISANNVYRSSRFFKIEGDTAYVALSKTADPESNPLLYKLPLSELK